MRGEWEAESGDLGSREAGVGFNSTVLPASRVTETWHAQQQWTQRKSNERSSPTAESGNRRDRSAVSLLNGSFRRSGWLLSTFRHESEKSL